MKIFAISDLHLTTSVDKPMDVFGGAWENYWEHIQESWRANVSDEDVVLIAGDISWAMRNDEAIADLHLIAALPGKKVIIRGNHDYWWSSYNKVNEILPATVKAIQNNAFKYGNVIVCGTRGWTVPIGESSDLQDKKIFDREVIRLKLTLDSALSIKQEGDKIILMLHYPPFTWSFADSEFTDLIKNYPVDAVVYGHLHGKDGRSELLLYKNGTPYYLTSCDKLNNELKLIMEV